MLEGIVVIDVRRDRLGVFLYEYRVSVEKCALVANHAERITAECDPYAEVGSPLALIVYGFDLPCGRSCLPFCSIKRSRYRCSSTRARRSLQQGRFGSE